MADDLEAFLRQAAQRRAQRKAPAATPPAPRTPTPRTTQPKKTRPGPAQRAGRPTQREVVEATVLPETSSRLETHVDTSEFEQRAEHLGEEVGLADEHLESHLHDKFDHQMGSLEESGRIPAGETREAAPLTPTDEIRQLLANANSLRDAIVLSEILSPLRPRW